MVQKQPAAPQGFLGPWRQQAKCFTACFEDKVLLVLAMAIFWNGTKLGPDAVQKAKIFIRWPFIETSVVSALVQLCTGKGSYLLETHGREHRTWAGSL